MRLRISEYKGFTLIELLIVVAIIGILSSIASVNYIQASIRAKVARAKSEMRAIATGLELYCVDYNKYPEWMYPPGFAKNPVSTRLIPITTPIAYLSSVPLSDLFDSHASPGTRSLDAHYDTYDYVDARSSFQYRGFGRSATRNCEWRLSEAGPDRVQGYGQQIEGIIHYGCDYDPTNGAVSIGDIVRTGPQTGKYGSPAPPINE
jgi:general secretion pathway protein G